MGSPVVTVGHKFFGYCWQCDRWVEGKMITGAEDRQIEGQNICVTGSVGQGDCGHFCESIGKSEVVQIDGKPIVRQGDPVTNGIEGTLIEGSDFVNSD